MKRYNKFLAVTLSLLLLITTVCTPIQINAEQSSNQDNSAKGTVISPKLASENGSEKSDTEGSEQQAGQTVSQDVYNPLTHENLLNFKASRFIIKYKNDIGIEDANSLIGEKIKKVKSIGRYKGKSFESISTNTKMNGNELLSLLKSKKLDKDIEYIQPDYEMNLSSNDPCFNQQWGVYNPETIKANVTDSVNGEVYTDYHVDANVVPAWEQSQGEGALVAVIDTGTDTAHEDLAENIWTNSGEIAGNGIDDDGNGYVDDVNGWNFCENTNKVHNPDSSSDEEHGTHIAGIIAAVKDNGKGITGVAPKAKIMPLKVFENGTAYTSDIIAAIKYAEENGAKIANCSWGTSSDNPALKEAIQNSSMLFVCAAGNSGVDIDTNPVYPASYDLDNIISVASINKDGSLSSFSNYGEKSVDVAAPGEGIYSTLPGNAYGAKDGTSMAAGFVSGEAALLLAKCPSFEALEIKQKIVDSADKYSNLIEEICEGNEIDCEKLLEGLTGVPITLENVENTASVTNDVYQKEGYNLLDTNSDTNYVINGDFDGSGSTASGWVGSESNGWCVVYNDINGTATLGNGRLKLTTGTGVISIELVNRLSQFIPSLSNLLEKALRPKQGIQYRLTAILNGTSVGVTGVRICQFNSSGQYIGDAVRIMNISANQDEAKDIVFTFSPNAAFYDVRTWLQNANQTGYVDKLSLSEEYLGLVKNGDFNGTGSSTSGWVGTENNGWNVVYNDINGTATLDNGRLKLTTGTGVISIELVNNSTQFIPSLQYLQERAQIPKIGILYRLTAILNGTSVGVTGVRICQFNSSGQYIGDAVRIMNSSVNQDEAKDFEFMFSPNAAFYDVRTWLQNANQTGYVDKLSLSEEYLGLVKNGDFNGTGSSTSGWVGTENNGWNVVYNDINGTATLDNGRLKLTTGTGVISIELVNNSTQFIPSLQYLQEKAQRPKIGIKYRLTATLNGTSVGVTGVRICQFNSSGQYIGEAVRVMNSSVNQDEVKELEFMFSPNAAFYDVRTWLQNANQTGYVYRLSLFEEYKELIKNGDFKASGVSNSGWIGTEGYGWYFDNYSINGTASYDSGKMKIEVTNTTMPNAYAIVLNGTLGNVGDNHSISVKPNTRYRLSGRIKTEAINGLKAQLCASEGIAGNSSWLQNHFACDIGSNQDWSWYTVEFITASATTHVQVRMQLVASDIGQSGRVWFDDVSLSEVNMLENGDFGYGSGSNTTNGWIGNEIYKWNFDNYSINGNAAYDSESMKIEVTNTTTSNAYAIVLNGTSTSVGDSHSIPVKPNTKYRLMGKVKTENINGMIAQLYACEGIAGNNGWIQTHYACQLTSNEDWTQYIIDFTTAPATTHVQIRMQLSATGLGQTGRAWFDDLNLIELNDDSAGNPVNTANYTINCSLNKQFDLVLKASNLQNLSQNKFTVTYNPNELDLVVPSDITGKKDLYYGNIVGTDITVIDFTPGNFVFTVDKTIPSGEYWTGIVNSMKFKSKLSSGTSTITYTVSR